MNRYICRDKVIAKLVLVMHMVLQVKDFSQKYLKFFLKLEWMCEEFSILSAKLYVALILKLDNEYFQKPPPPPETGSHILQVGCL